MTDFDRADAFTQRAEGGGRRLFRGPGTGLSQYDLTHKSAGNSKALSNLYLLELSSCM